MRVAVVMPIYNERALIEAVLARFDQCPLEVPGLSVDRVLVLVDDGSTDGTREVLARWRDQWRDRPGVVVHLREANGGKGSAVRDGLRLALELGADVVLIHDADLEYDPADHGRAVGPISRGEADAVVGNRFHAGNDWHRLEFWRAGVGGVQHRVANRVLTMLSNVFTGLRLLDMECCTKAMSRAVVEQLRLEEPRFGLEPELAAKLGRMRLDGRRLRVAQVDVRYQPRGWAQGKKIGWRDGLRAVWVILRYGVGQRRA